MPDAVSWVVLGSVACIVLVGAVAERTGVLDLSLDRAPSWLLAGVLVVGGWNVFAGVVRLAWRRRINSHTLMSLGVVAAVGVGEWTTALLIVFFMRFANWIEARTTDRSRRALADLIALAPATARIARDDGEAIVPIGEVRPGDVIRVRPGERIPVDGVVLDGNAPVDEAAITGESTPSDKGLGDTVFAATVVHAGALTIRTTRTAGDTTFGRVVALVEQADTHKAPIQRIADRFAARYLPIVIVAALVTLIATGDVLRAVAVVVVACACAIVIATPVVVLATVATAGRRGLVIKGGDALERLSRVDTLVLDKTGTLTTGNPEVTDVVCFDPRLDEDTLIGTAAAVEAASEHPLAAAITRAGRRRGIRLLPATGFTVKPGRGVEATVDGRRFVIGNRGHLTDNAVKVSPDIEQAAVAFEQQGKTVFFVASPDDGVIGLVAVADTIRPDVAAALQGLRRLGITRQVMLTGDNDRVAAAIASELGIDWHAQLLPEDKITAVEQLQRDGRVVLMVGDGINDAPALAQADVGAALGSGTDVALEAGTIAVLRDDWHLLPDAIVLGRRAARMMRQNLYFTAAYNSIGIALAALGVLPPIWAAAAQSLPDIAIVANAGRLLRRRTVDLAKTPSPAHLTSGARTG